MLERTGILIPNRSELATIAGGAIPQTETEVVALASTLATRWARQGHDVGSSATVGTDHGIIVTLGADGILVIDDAGPRHIPARPVEPVDTTGAGDCFCGSLAGRLAVGDAMPDALAFAMTAAAISVTRAGASDSMPMADEVAAALDDST